MNVRASSKFQNVIEYHVRFFFKSIVFRILEWEEEKQTLSIFIIISVLNMNEIMYMLHKFEIKDLINFFAAYLDAEHYKIIC